MEFALKILELCAEHKASVTSWCRTEKRNREVGGAEHSYHLTGEAVDLVLDNPAKSGELIRAAEALKLTAFHEQGHIHIQIGDPKK